MKHFFRFLKFTGLFGSHPDDSQFFGETIKLYAKMNGGALRQFLEEYARATTERDVHRALQKGENPSYDTFKEVKKLITFLDNVEKNFGHSKEKNIR